MSGATYRFVATTFPASYVAQVTEQINCAFVTLPDAPLKPSLNLVKSCFQTGKGDLEFVYSPLEDCYVRGLALLRVITPASNGAWQDMESAGDIVQVWYEKIG